MSFSVGGSQERIGSTRALLLPRAARRIYRSDVTVRGQHLHQCTASPMASGAAGIRGKCQIDGWSPLGGRSTAEDGNLHSRLAAPRSRAARPHTTSFWRVDGAARHQGPGAWTQATFFTMLRKMARPLWL